jgi:hypothetical protein
MRGKILLAQTVENVSSRISAKYQFLKHQAQNENYLSFALP